MKTVELRLAASFAYNGGNLSMKAPIAYLRGQFLPLAEAKLPVHDLGLQGMAVTETVRTFGHRPFRIDDHLDRLAASLDMAAIDLPMPFDELRSISLQVIDHNAPLIAPGDDLGLTLFVTAGLNLTYLGAGALDECRRPTVGVHTWRLPVELWVERRRTGQHLVTPDVRQIPAECLDPRIKSRSRLHWHVADAQARAVDPQASALLLSAEGFVTETATANFFIVRDGAMLTPRMGAALAGVSQAVVRELACELRIEYLEADLRPADVESADEAFTSSTPYCLLPAVRFNNRPIGNGAPGTVYAKLLAAWSNLVGVDLNLECGDPSPLSFS
ncbi:MAG TPA: aminotransferase class IV [Planctomycetaceae bacterium]|nr:aminotransferase class IV [Planctomycetaceae bacterium]